MQSSRLHIDTKIANVSGPYSTSKASGRLSRASENSARLAHNRLRSPSNASTTSSISLVSPGPSSSNISPTSATRRHFQHEELSPSQNDFRLSQDGGHNADEFVLAMHDFAPNPPNNTCLSFHAGQIVHVLNRDASGWWDGELDGRRGWFPSNYVNSDIASSPFVDENNKFAKRSSHAHTSSASSWGSAVSPVGHTRGQKSLMSDQLGSDIDTYCPPLMVPLLHGISLLQAAAKSHRFSHFEPSTACIISCVRSVLAATHCLQRESSIYLNKYPVLFTERKRILKDLASLITQAKIAADDLVTEIEREPEIEMMLKLGLQVFTHVRRFLAVAIQCGIDVPETQQNGSDDETPERDESLEDTPQPQRVAGSQYRRASILNPVQARQSVNAAPLKPRTQGEMIRSSRSMSDLKAARRPVQEKALQRASVQPPARGPQPTTRMYSQLSHGPQPITRMYSQLSHESTDTLSSISSGSENDAEEQPPVIPFPTGPCTLPEVLEALKNTNDNYLSTVAAFVGHAHSHSRASYGPNAANMQDLVSEVVDTVCKIIVIVDALLVHPDVPPQRIHTLRATKEGLFTATTSLADVVRSLSRETSELGSEEEEQAQLIRCATSALKAGADCVNAIRICLSRISLDKPFILNLLPSNSNVKGSRRPSKLGLSKAVSMGALKAQYENVKIAEEDESSLAPSSTGTAPSSFVMSSDDSMMSNTSSLVSVSTILTSDDDSATETTSRRPPILHSLTSPVLGRINTVPEGVIWDKVPPTPGGDDGVTAAMEEKLVGEQAHHSGPGRVPGINPANPLSWQLAHDYRDEEVAYNADGQLIGASLPVLVEHLTPQGSTADAAFCAIFWPTFRLFTTPLNLFNALIARYSLQPPPTLQDEKALVEWQNGKLLPIRLRVVNTIKQWLETKWRASVDAAILDTMEIFTQRAIAEGHFGAWARIQELITMRRTSPAESIGVDRPKDGGLSLNPPPAVGSSGESIPRPTMTKALMAQLKAKNFSSIAIVDFDPLELARQLTITENKVYCAVSAEEILETVGRKENASPPATVRALSTLSTVVTGWVTECILNESDTKKRTALLKFFIKVCDRCVSIHNYSTTRSILAALDSSTIARLRQTWAGLSQKTRHQMEQLRKYADHGRNYQYYRGKLRATNPPAIPFMGIYLTDITFCREGNPDMRPSGTNKNNMLINFNKYYKLASIVQDMERFQVPYNLVVIPEAQEYLNEAFEQSKSTADVHDLYRRSLLVEPRMPADTPPASANEVGKLFSWATRNQTQQPSQMAQLTA